MRANTIGREIAVGVSISRALVAGLSAAIIGCAWGEPGGSGGRTFIFQDPIFWIIVVVGGVGALIAKLRGED